MKCVVDMESRCSRRDEFVSALWSKPAAQKTFDTVFAAAITSCFMHRWLRCVAVLGLMSCSAPKSVPQTSPESKPVERSTSSLPVRMHEPCRIDNERALFHRPDATHVLVTEFSERAHESLPSAEAIAAQIHQAYKKTREEFQQHNERFDVWIFEDSLEVVSLPCFVRDEDNARDLVKTSSATFILWGSSSCIDNVEKHRAPAGTCVSVTVKKSQKPLRLPTERQILLHDPERMELPTFTEWTGLAHYALGMHFHAREEYPLAAWYFGLSMERAVKGSHHYETPIMMRGLAQMHGRDWEAAAESNHAALVQVRGTQSEMEAVVLGRLGAVFHARGLYADAEARFQQALNRAEALGGRDLLTASLVTGLGNALWSRGQFADAEVQFRRALSIVEKIASAESAPAVTIVHDLGWALLEQGKLVEAEALFRQALENDRQRAGLDHHSVERDEDALATVLARQGKYDEAEDMSYLLVGKNPVSIRRKSPDIARYYNTLGVIRYHERAYLDAAQNFAIAVELTDASRGPDHPIVVEFLLNLGTTALALQEKSPDPKVDLNGLPMARKVAKSANKRGKTSDEDDDDDPIDMTVAGFDIGQEAARRGQEPRQTEAAWSPGKVEAATVYLERASRVARKTLGLAHPLTQRVDKRLDEVKAKQSSKSSKKKR